MSLIVTSPLEVDSEEVGEAILAISEPASVHADHHGAGLKTGLMIAGGLGIGAGLFYLLGPQLARRI